MPTWNSPALHRRPSVADPRRRFGNLTVTGLVFFGPRRKQRQQIVQCYIERNLVSNGGLLAEVIWQIQETAEPHDVAFLQVSPRSMARGSRGCAHSGGKGFMAGCGYLLRV